MNANKRMKIHELLINIVIMSMDNELSDISGFLQRERERERERE